jgi:hypothetical protein
VATGRAVAAAAAPVSQPDAPCGVCRDGEHQRCVDACGCLADHADDSTILRGFKRLKRIMHPERESWTAGGWS